MDKKIEFEIKNLQTKNDKYSIEKKIDSLGGIKNIEINDQTGKCQVEFDDKNISKTKILEKIEELGYKVSTKSTDNMSDIQERTYFVQGMHCPSCELIIEKKLIQQKNIKSIDASAKNGQVVVHYKDKYPTPGKLNTIFKKDGYTFSCKALKERKEQPLIKTGKDGQWIVNSQKLNDLSIIAGTSLVLIIAFMALSKSGLTSLISVNTTSALPMFLFFGVLAGLSSCAALVGGIVLSMSKQWSDIFGKDESTFKKLQPHLLFNLGRLASYGVLGALLGAIGSAFQLSLTFTTILIFGVAVMMLFLGLQMLGVKQFQRYQFTAPKFITRYVAEEKNFNGRYMPVIMGALTFFLPCGFTITAQSLALASGNVVQGSLIMLFFAAGTLPMLLTIGFSSVKFSKQPHLASRFLKVAGVLVVFFAIFNINSQLNVLGWTSLSDIRLKTSTAAVSQDDGLPPIVDGKQILKMDAIASGYSPSNLKVKAGIPVRWEITDKGSSGCTNAVMARGLFDGEIALTKGETSIKEFTVEKPGKYKFSCWMGMVSGVIEVVDDSGNSPVVADDEIVPSGAKGCGCGSGSGSCGG